MHRFSAVATSNNTLSTDCSYVGRRTPQALGFRDTRNHMRMMLNATFPCDTTIKAWLYHRSRSGPNGIATVFREVPASSSSRRRFQVISRTILPDAEVGPQIVIPQTEIDVREGDLIAMQYPENATTGILSNCRSLYHSICETDTMFETLLVLAYDKPIGYRMELSKPIPFSVRGVSLTAITNSSAVEYWRNGKTRSTSCVQH